MHFALLQNQPGIAGRNNLAQGGSPG